MSPQEKAEQLVNKFGAATLAITCVVEIIEETTFGCMECGGGYYGKDFWIEVFLILHTKAYPLQKCSLEIEGYGTYFDALIKSIRTQGYEPHIIPIDSMKVKIEWFVNAPQNT